MLRLSACLVVTLLVGVPQAFAAPILIFAASGDAPLVVLPGVTAVPVAGAGTALESSEGFNGVGGFFGNVLRASGSVGTAFYELTLGNLPAHTSLDVNFLFAAIDSWDGGDVGTFSPDFFNVSIDGTTVLTMSCVNFDAGMCTAGTVVAPLAHRGFNGNYQDLGVDLSGVGALNVAHTGSTAVVRLFASGAGYQGGTDESWAVDNFNITVDSSPIPEPGSLALLGLGLAGLISRRLSRDSAPR